ncbi:centromere K [Paramuricea clavata]|uniref:Centromere K n=1 Tax=Paramuricea clavata TaxID=317549 RepID=A0A6S7G4F4_PARCT|nr:centromere K [Paramuricea clavata]
MASTHVQSFQSPTSSAGIRDSRQETRREIMDECEVTWENIQKTHHRLASRKKERPPVGTDESNATLKILQHKEKRLQAQLDLRKNQDIEVVSKDPQFVETLLWNDMKKNISHLQQALGIVKEQRVEVAGDIATARKYLEEQKAIQRSLEEKIQAFQLEDDEQQHTSVLAELQSKKKEASKYHLTVMNQLGKFLSDHFPAPNDDSDDSEDNRPRRQRQYCSLQHIIEVNV